MLMEKARRIGVFGLSILVLKVAIWSLMLDTRVRV